MRCELCSRDLDPNGGWTQAVTVDPNTGFVCATQYYCAGRRCQPDADAAHRPAATTPAVG